MEEWRNVINYEGVYLVSDDGNVRSLITNKILKINYGTSGYAFVNLYKNKKGTARMVHQLVAESFLSHTPCGQKIVVDHINSDKKDNRLCNLQLVTQRHNSLKDKTKPKSGVHGVSWSTSNQKWQVRPRVNGKKIHVGYFDCKKYAGKVYEDFTNLVDTYGIDSLNLSELKVIYKDKIKKYETNR